MRSLLCVCLLSSCLLAFVSCRSSTSGGVRVDSTLGSFVPPTTGVLAGIDLERIKTSSLYKRHEQQLNLTFLNEFSERTGIDARRDVASLLIAWPANQPVVIAKGRFAEAEVGRKLQNHVFFPKRNILLATLDPSGRPPTQQDGNGGVPQAVKDRMTVLSGEDQIWLVSSQSLPVSRIPLRPDLQSALSNLIAYVTGASMGVSMTDGAQFESELMCVSPQGAKQVHDAIRGGIGLARLTTKDDELDLLRVYDAIQVTQDGQTVRVRAELPAGLADRLIKQLEH